MLSLSSTDPLARGLGGAGGRENNNKKDNICWSSISVDDSLTSLQWLQEFLILGANVPQQAHQQPNLFGQQVGYDPASPSAGDPSSIGMPLTMGKPTAAAYSRMESLPDGVANGHCPDKSYDMTNVHIKPPYSYATLICMAMRASKENKITLSCIYKWITDNFCYYRHADPTWQNSIRTNLSLNKYFIKVPRQKDEPGKGCFWKIDPQYAERLLSSAYKKTRIPPVHINPTLQSRLRVNLQPQPRCSCINSESQRFLRDFKDATGADQNWDPHMAEGTMLGSWPVDSGRGGHKRKQSMGTRNRASKVPRHFSPPPFPVDGQKEIGPLKGDVDWVGLLDSALSRELNRESVEPLRPIIKGDDLTVWGTHITPGEDPVGTADIHGLVETQRSKDFDEETFLATAFLESPWPQEEKQGHNNFLCSSTVDLDQLFDLELSVDGDTSLQIETLL
ncbi:hypothetical protein Q5P01_019355 [Channa striata]|uniref:Fork-head domain-containing protein n=1 Tax=Channa striata TaxID=64152 RepID=A0AA88M0W8_CHASR|nr:hypothetical protein Q5P01_019355 [Channa striata]